MPFNQDSFCPSQVRSGPKGWYSRGYLPHRDEPGVLQFLTFHEADALPRYLLDRWRDEVAHLAPERRKAAEQQRIMAHLDQGEGACRLTKPGVAETIERVLLTFHGTRYDVEAWTIMPNHAHLLVRFYDDVSMTDEIKAMKGVSAREANKILGRTGRLWYREFYDRYIRDADHYSRVRAYIDHNPVKAGLSGCPQDWPFGSARHQMGA